MRIIADHVSPRTFDKIDKVENTQDEVHLRHGVLTAGKSWKGRIVSFLETVDYFGVFKDYCTNFRTDQAKTNRYAAETVWRALVTHYGVENARQGLDNLSPRFRGMDTLKARQGLITYSEVDKTARLTCGEIRALLDTTKVMSRRNPLSSAPAQPYTIKNAFDELRPMLMNAIDRTQKQLDKLKADVKRDKEAKAAAGKEPAPERTVPPPSDEEKLYYVGAAKHSDALTPALVNHQRAKMFMSEPQNMIGLMKEIKANPEKLKPGRLEYITSRVFKEIRERFSDKELSRTEVQHLVQVAMEESLRHRVSWNRMQAVRMGVGKKVSGAGSDFAQDVERLVVVNRNAASAAITPDFVINVARQEGYALKDVQVTNIIKAALDVVERTVRNQRIDLNKSDYREIVRREIIP